MDVFKDAKDRAVYFNLFKRHLSPEAVRDPFNRQYAHLHDSVQLGAFCLMPNHVHFLLRTGPDPRSIEQLMRRVMSSYCKYFNQQHSRVGPVFQGRLAARPASDAFEVKDLVAYLHLNYNNDPTYRYCSHLPLVRGTGPPWLSTQPLLDLFGSVPNYTDWLSAAAQRKRARRALELSGVANHDPYCGVVRRRDPPALI